MKCSVSNTSSFTATHLFAGKISEEIREMERITSDLLSKWYTQVHKLVLSRTMKGQDLPNTEILSDNIPAQINQIRQKPGNDILVFGSPSATHSLIQWGLIDGYWLFVNPVILGNGISLFEGIKEKIKLKLLNTHRFACGVTELNYEVEK